MRVRAVLAIAVALFVLAIEAWSVLPAPTLPLLAFAVAIPELAPWGVALAAFAIFVAAALARGPARFAALVIAGTALCCAAWPLVALPSTIARTHDALAIAGYGHDEAGRAFSLRRSFFGSAHRTRIRLESGLAFTTRDGATLHYDVYRPLARGAHPTLIAIHGGGWVFGSRGAEATIGRTFAELGYTVISPDYRLAPHVHFPTQLHDVDDAIAAVARDRVRLGVDPERVAIMGRSAGAELALLAAYEPQPLRVRAAIGYYAPVDLVAGYRVLPTFDPADVRSLLRAYIGGTPGRYPVAYRAASPEDRISPRLPPTLLISGDRDQLVRVDFQREMSAALRAAGDRVVAIELPWSNHAFDQVPNGLGAQIATDVTLRFLDATTAASDSVATRSSSRVARPRT